MVLSFTISGVIFDGQNELNSGLEYDVSSKIIRDFGSLQSFIQPTIVNMQLWTILTLQIAQTKAIYIYIYSRCPCHNLALTPCLLLKIIICNFPPNVKWRKSTNLTVYLQELN